MHRRRCLPSVRWLVVVSRWVFLPQSSGMLVCHAAVRSAAMGTVAAAVGEWKGRARLGPLVLGRSHFHLSVVLLICSLCALPDTFISSPLPAQGISSASPRSILLPLVRRYEVLEFFKSDSSLLLRCSVSTVLLT